MYNYILALGSNLGDRQELLQQGCRSLCRQGEITAVSSVWQTAPVGMEPSPDFLNAAIHYRSSLEPLELLAMIKQIEQAAGRDIQQIKKSRPLDIDIIYRIEGGFQHPNLEIPHRSAALRKFVILPVNEIRPGTFPDIEDETQQITRTELKLIF